MKKIKKIIHHKVNIKNKQKVFTIATIASYMGNTIVETEDKIFEGKYNEKSILKLLGRNIVKGINQQKRSPLEQEQISYQQKIVMEKMSQKLSPKVKIKNKTIILISSKQSGSFGIQKIFMKHPEVNLYLDESGFWSKGGIAVEKDNCNNFIKMMKKHPHTCGKIKISKDQCKDFTKENLVNIWNKTLKKYGPVAFEKDPHYFVVAHAFDMLKAYKDAGNDVRVFFLIRDARDALLSLSGKNMPHKFNKERKWLRKYEEDLPIWQKEFKAPIWRYEDIVLKPNKYVPQIMDYCGLSTIPSTYKHLSSHFIGLPRKRYQNVDWEPCDKIKEHLIKWGYEK